MSNLPQTTFFALLISFWMSMTLGSDVLAQSVPLIPSADARAVLTLPSGDILVGTTGGLALYDKSLNLRKTVFSRDGFPGTAVLSLAMGPNQTVWVGTNQGLAQVSIHPTISVVKKIKVGKVRAILPVSDKVYIGVFGKGVYRIKGGTLQQLTFTKNTNPAAKRVTSLAYWQGKIIAGTAGAGLFSLTHRRFAPLKVVMPYGMVFALETHQGQLYAGTVEGFFSVTLTQGHLIHSADTRVLVSGSNSLWVGTYGNGVFKYKNSTLHKVAPHRTVGFVNGISIGNQQILVAAKKGIRQIQMSTSKILQSREELIPSTDISATALVDNRLWVGTFDAGLGYFDQYPVAPKWVPVSNRHIDSRINALGVDKTGNGTRVWVGTDRGLTLIDVREKKMTFRHINKAMGLPSNIIHGIVVLQNGEALLGTGRYAARVDAALNVTVIGLKNSMPNRAVWAVAEDSHRCYLLGTTAGLFRKCPNHPNAQRFTVATGHLADDWVTAIRTQDNRVWVGTYSHGVTQLTEARDSAGAKNAKDADALLPYQMAYTAIHLGGGYINPAGLYINGNTLLAATMGGLKYQSISASSPNWQVRKNAAPGKDVTTITPGKGHLIIGSRNGLGYFRI